MDMREAKWLDGQRVRVYCALLAAASLAMMVPFYLEAVHRDGSDFLAFWGAAKAVVHGHPAQAYDLGAQEKIQLATGAPGWFAFVNPPPFLFVVAPVGYLSFPQGWIAWVGVTWAIWAWAACRIFPRLWLPILAFPGALIAASHAQNGFVTGALLIGGVALLNRRPGTAGMLLGALVIKPHLALLVPFWLAAGGQWRAFWAAAASAVGLVALSCAVFGSGILGAYMTSWGASAHLMQTDRADFYLRMCTLYSQLHLVLPASFALALQGAVTLGMLALAVLSWRRLGRDAMGSGALVLACAALATPYLFNYDLPFLILPILWLVQQGRAAGFRPYEKVGLVVLYFSPFATRAISLPTHVNLMPLAAAALVWLVWSRGGNGALSPAETPQAG